MKSQSYGRQLGEDAYFIATGIESAVGARFDVEFEIKVLQYHIHEAVWQTRETAQLVFREQLDAEIARHLSGEEITALIMGVA